MPSKTIVVGLGNPGKEYEATYHNIGILALQAISPVGTWKKHKNLFTYLEADGLVFVQPLTYMNESGKAVRAAVRQYTADPKRLVVIHDESDLVVGTYKLSVARNSAGHKGVQSIIDLLGTNDFTRVRIGIRPARETTRKKASDLALKQISATDKKSFAHVFATIKEKLPTFIDR